MLDISVRLDYNNKPSLELFCLEKKLKCIFQTDILIYDGRLKFDRFFEGLPTTGESKSTFYEIERKLKVLSFANTTIDPKS